MEHRWSELAEWLRMAHALLDDKTAEPQLLPSATGSSAQTDCNGTHGAPATKTKQALVCHKPAPAL